MQEIGSMVWSIAWWCVYSLLVAVAIAGDLLVVNVGYVVFLLLVWSGQKHLVMWLAEMAIGGDR